MNFVLKVGFPVRYRRQPAALCYTNVINKNRKNYFIPELRIHSRHGSESKHDIRKYLLKELDNL